MLRLCVEPAVRNDRVEGPGLSATSAERRTTAAAGNRAAKTAGQIALALAILIVRAVVADLLLCLLELQPLPPPSLKSGEPAQRPQPSDEHGRVNLREPALR